jgi:hypothetical protein
MNAHKVPRTPGNHPDLIHSSSRSSISTNASAVPGKSARTTLRTTRLDIRWADGDLEMRFAAHVVDVTPNHGNMLRRNAR